MCGISGIFAYSANDFDHSDLRMMHSAIPHRGPDGEGFYADSFVGMAHRRLAIIDTAPSANQPYFFGERYVLVFNGEIYNYIELRKELASYGYKFRTNSDVEVLIVSYAHWGKACQDRFNGMWSFLVWDRFEKILFCSRDRYGIKPLYLSKLDNKYYFASEPKQLCSLGLGSVVDVSELSLFLFAGISSSSESTFFSGIKSLPPGHCLTLSPKSRPVLDKWYDVNRIITPSQSFPQLLVDSVSLRLRSDVPVGSCLSGGLDSSAIVMIASSLLRNQYVEPLKCIHARSIDPEVDESSFASLVANSSYSDLSTVTPLSEQFWSSIYSICRTQDEPFGSPSICMQYFVMQHARNLGCTVMLDGQGADELLLGYSKYMILALSSAWSSGGLKELINTLFNSWSANSSLTPLSTLQYLVATLLSPLRSLRVKRRLHFLDLPLEPVRNLYSSISSASADCRETQILELFKTSLPALLRYEDRNSMAHSVEARLPFLDFRLVESALSMRVDQKISNGWSKYPLRQSGILPESVAWRRSKLGFNAPERSWIGDYSRKMLELTLDSPLIGAFANRIALEHSWYRLDRREQWRLFNVAVWADIYGVRP